MCLGAPPVGLPRPGLGGLAGDVDVVAGGQFVDFFEQLGDLLFEHLVVAQSEQLA